MYYKCPALHDTGYLAGYQKLKSIIYLNAHDVPRVFTHCDISCANQDHQIIFEFITHRESTIICLNKKLIKNNFWST